MRDIVIVGIVLLGALCALRRPWIGVLLWTWLSLMNPHRFTYGFAYDFPVALIAAASTLAGLLFAEHKANPFGIAAPPNWLALFMLWITFSWQFGMNPGGDYAQWDKVMKILFMVMLALVLMQSKEQIFGFIWVCAGSMALLGIKGGIFTILTGGNHRVWGPPGSFIEENNSLALALVMTIPLLRFLQLQVQNRWGRRALLVAMLLLAASALGSHSRGGLLSIAAMAALLWWRGGNRGASGVLLVLGGLALVAFMPEHWTQRMSTIETYDEDRSAMGRIAAWWTAWNLAFDYPFGVGFNAARQELFAVYSPYGLRYGTPVAHSIYFQVLGHHGFVGLGLWLTLWVSCWRLAARIRREVQGIAEARWCGDLANMIQVSLFGYAIGGAFLSLAYFDQPYNLMVMLVLTHAWVKRQAWKKEKLPRRSWWLSLPGLRGPAAPTPQPVARPQLARGARS